MSPAAVIREFSGASVGHKLRTAALFTASAALIAAGFAVDGASEIGHHAGFILGGVALGYGFGRR